MVSILKSDRHNTKSSVV